MLPLVKTRERERERADVMLCLGSIHIKSIKQTSPPSASEKDSLLLLVPRENPLQRPSFFSLSYFSHTQMTNGYIMR